MPGPLTPQERETLAWMLTRAQDPAARAEAQARLAAEPPPPPPAPFAMPDLGMQRAPAPPATVDMRSAPLTPADVERMNQQDADAKTGLRVAAINSYQRQEEAKKAAAAGLPAPPAPAAAPIDETLQGAPPVNYPPARFVPGGWQERSRQVHEGIPVSDEVRAGMLAAERSEDRAIDMGEQAAVSRQRAEASVLNDTAADLAAMRMAAADREAARQDALRKEQSLLADQTAKYNRVAEVDPGRYWAKRGTGGTVMAILGVALGGFAAGLRGGENQALRSIEAAIDRDIDAQKATAAAQRGKVADQRGLLAEMRATFGDERQAELATRAAYLQKVKFDLDSLAARSGSEETKARAEAMRGELEMKYTMLQDKFAERAADKITRADAYRPAGYVGGPPAAAKSNGKEDLFVPTDAKGGGYFARTVDEAKKGRALRLAVSQFENIRNEAVRLRGATSGAERAAGKYTPFESEDFSALDSQAAQAVLAVKDAEELGALDKGAAEFGGKVVGDLSRVGGNPTKATDAYLANLKRKLSEFERAQAGQGAQQSIAVDQAGRNVAITQGQTSFAAPRPGMPKGTVAVVPGTGPVPDAPSPQRQHAPIGVVKSDARSKEKIEDLTRERDYFKREANMSAAIIRGRPAATPKAAAGAPLSAAEQRRLQETMAHRVPMPPPPTPDKPAGFYAVDPSTGLTVGHRPVPQPAWNYGEIDAPTPRQMQTFERTNPLHQQLDAMPPTAFNYTDPAQDGAGRRAGVIAQDAERGPYGEALVRNTPQGKVIDGNAGLSLALAAAADQHRRLRKLEGS